MIPLVLYRWNGNLLKRTIGGVTGLATAEACCCGCDCDDLPDTLWLTAEVWQADVPYPLYYYDSYIIQLTRGPGGIEEALGCYCEEGEQFRNCWYGSFWSVDLNHYTGLYPPSILEPILNCVRLACGPYGADLRLFGQYNRYVRIGPNPDDFDWLDPAYPEIGPFHVPCEAIDDPGSLDACWGGNAYFRNLCLHLQDPS